MEDAPAPVSDDLGRVAADLLCKYLGDIYQPSASPSADEASVSAADFYFLQAVVFPQSGISVPPDFLAEFDRIAALSTLKHVPIG